MAKLLGLFPLQFLFWAWIPHLTKWLYLQCPSSLLCPFALAQSGLKIRRLVPRWRNFFRKPEDSTHHKLFWSIQTQAYKHIGSDLQKVLFKVLFLALFLGKELFLALFWALLIVPELFLALFCALFFHSPAICAPIYILRPWSCNQKIIWCS